MIRRCCRPQSAPFDLADTAGSGLITIANAGEPGLLRIVMYGAMPIDKDGVLLNLKFNVVGSAGSTSPFTFERIVFNEDEIRTTTSDGQVEVSAAVND